MFYKNCYFSLSSKCDHFFKIFASEFIENQEEIFLSTTYIVVYPILCLSCQSANYPFRHGQHTKLLYNVYIYIIMHVVPREHFFNISRNSEANTSEFLEILNLEEIFPHYLMMN